MQLFLGWFCSFDIARLLFVVFFDLPWFCRNFPISFAWKFVFIFLGVIDFSHPGTKAATQHLQEIQL